MSREDFDKQCENHLNWVASLLEESNNDSPLIEVPTNTQKNTQIPTKPQQEEIQYRISDIVVNSDSEDDSDCEDYYVEDAEEIHGKAIPNWARAANLINELKAQAKLDPDTIFYGFPNTCDLNLVFNKKKHSYKVRGESGMWNADKLTAEEIQSYKKAVGFA